MHMNSSCYDLRFEVHSLETIILNEITFTVTALILLFLPDLVVPETLFDYR